VAGAASPTCAAVAARDAGSPGILSLDARWYRSFSSGDSDAWVAGRIAADQLEYILIHELAHIVRRDYLVNLLQTFVEGLCLSSSGVVGNRACCRAERENCCDDAVVVCSGPRDTQRHWWRWNTTVQYGPRLRWLRLGAA